MNEVLTAGTIDVDRIRSRFPALAGKTVLLENAGGSQVPEIVADAIRDYMLESYVQLEAGYPASDRADAVVHGAHAFVNRLMNGTDTGQVILGPSTTQLVTMLSQAYAGVLEAGDEIIVTETAHEANLGPWLPLAERGVEVRMWKMDPDTLTCPHAGLESLLTPRTKIVALPHVSNLLGEIVDVAEITRIAHAAGARVVVDGVAYAPHRAIDVAAWDVDWYVYSTYKVYGPHMAALYGRADALAEITGPNHFFIPRDQVPYKFEVGGVCHEGCAGVLALETYLAFLAGLGAEATGEKGGETAPDGRRAIETAFAVMIACELPLQRRLVEYLGTKSKVRLVGPAHGEAGRVGTISFVHAEKSSRSIVAAAHAGQIGIRNGHMYAHRLCAAAGIEPEDGVVRVSLVHYNTIEEIERLIDVLETVL